MIGYCGWVGDGLTTVAEVEEFFARTCYEVDQRLGEPAGVRWLLNWYDDTHRDTMRKELIYEVRKSLYGTSKEEKDVINTIMEIFP